MPSIIKVDQIQSDLGTVNVSSNLQFSSGFTMRSPTISTPTFTGQATIPTINLTGGQIVFPATQSASGDANTLDDYEEGSFTPTVSFALASVGLTYTSRPARYIKIGRTVNFQIEITLSNKGSSTGYITIGSLPFSNNGDVRAGCSVYMSTGLPVNTQIIGTDIYIYVASGSNVTNMTDSSVTNTTSLDRKSVV